MKILNPDWDWNGGLGKRAGLPPYVVLHNVGSKSSPAAIHAYHIGLGWRGIAYHEHIDFDGTVTIGRPSWAMGGHCHNFNHCYGIVVNGNYDSIREMPKAQREALEARIKAARSRWPKIKIAGHREMPGNATGCPGKYYPLADMKRIVVSDLVPSAERPQLAQLLLTYALRSQSSDEPVPLDGWEGLNVLSPHWGPAKRLLAKRVSYRVRHEHPEVTTSDRPTRALYSALRKGA